MIKAVLDTNVFVSALIVKHGKPAQILDFARRKQFTVLLSEEILAEAREVLHRKRIRKRFILSEDEVQSYLDGLRQTSVMIAGASVEDVIPNDPPDNLVLACAVGGEANYLVSGNEHFLALEKYRAIQMITPADFLQVLVQPVSSSEAAITSEQAP